MLTIRAAATLLQASSSANGLIDLSRAVGGTVGPPAPLDADACDALGLGAETLHAHLFTGHGSLRVLALTTLPNVGLRDLISRLSKRLGARAPHALWLLVVSQHQGDGVAIAAWHAAGRRQSGGLRSHVAALVADRRAIVDSDAETVRALSAASDGDALTTHARWVDVLGREALSRRFFSTLERLVDRLAGSAFVGTDEARAELALLHAFSMLFLAFLEAKGWLNGDRAFLGRAFDDCMRSGGGFHGRVVLPLFFGTLNTPVAKRSSAARSFGRIPFLNGGLFTPTALERRHRDLRFDDAAMGALFGEPLSCYRFTAREESATFQEAAIDPEMLGRAFESLMVSRSRRATGAFYTPYELVDCVATSGLSDALVSTLGESVAERVLCGDLTSPAMIALALAAQWLT